MHVLWFLIIGGVAGWLAGVIVKGKGFGLIGNIVVGVIGAVVGGLVFDFLDIRAAGLIGSLLMALIGAVLLIWIVRLFAR